MWDFNLSTIKNNLLESIMWQKLSDSVINSIITPGMSGWAEKTLLGKRR